MNVCYSYELSRYNHNIYFIILFVLYVLHIQNFCSHANPSNKFIWSSFDKVETWNMTHYIFKKCAHMHLIYNALEKSDQRAAMNATVCRTLLQLEQTSRSKFSHVFINNCAKLTWLPLSDIVEESKNRHEVFLWRKLSHSILRTIV